MDIERNKKVVREYAAAFSRGDIDAVRRCFAPGALVYGVLGWGDLEVAKPIWNMLVTAFQINLKIENLAAEGNIVAARYTESGKFVAPFRDTAPTGKTYEVVAMEWFEFNDHGIIRRWGARDFASMCKQLGIPPA